VTVGPADEAPRPPRGEGFSDAVTVAFGDPRADLYGVARLGLAGGGASGLAIVFHGGEPVAVSAEGGVAAEGAASFDDVSAAGLDMTIVEPLRAWRLQFAGDDAALDLELTADGALAELDPTHPVAAAGGMSGYEQPCVVTGSATVDGERLTVEGRGQRGHSWGAPDWERIELARTVSAWMGGGHAVTLTAVRPAGAGEHEAEHVAATVLGDEGAVAVADPRLSTTYDAGGHQQAAGLEHWLDEDKWPLRAAGEVLCGTSLDLGRLRLDCAFFRWRMEGRAGFGRYDLLRRVDAA